MQTIKQFLKPSWKKTIFFLILFLIMFFKLPFVNSSTSQGAKSLLWLTEKYSSQKEISSIIVSGFIGYFIVAYFISCLAVSLWGNFKDKK